MQEIEQYEGVSGELVTSDYNGDGVIDDYSYIFSEEEVMSGVFIQETAYVNNEDGTNFEQWLLFHMRNDLDEDVYLEYLLDIPKEYAASMDELWLSQEPIEIVEADPKARFGFDLKAHAPPEIKLAITKGDADIPAEEDVEKIFMNSILTTAVEKCEQLEDVFRAWCYYHVVEDFQDYVDHAVLMPFCERANESRLITPVCKAMLYSDPSYCANIKNLTDKEICMAKVIKTACSSLPLEDRELCYAEGSLELNSWGGCILIPEGDIKNDCLGRVGGNGKYCAYIIDTELRAQCIAFVNGDKQAMSDIVKKDEKTSDKDYKKFEDWFSYKNNAADCKRFEATTGYPVIDYTNHGWNLTCHWGKPGASHALSDLWIFAYESEKAAKEAWDKGESFGVAPYDEMITRDETVHSIDNGDNWEYVTYTEYTTYNPPGWYYTLNCGRTYKNVIINYNQEAMTALDTDNCKRIGLDAMLLIDEKIGK